MRFGRLVLHNFCRMRHVEIDLSQKGITWLRGINKDVGHSNEAGKSTIPRGISWILFGRFPDGPARPGDELVNPLEGHDCYGELEIFDQGDTPIIAKRTRMEGPKHKDAKFYLTYEGETQVIDLRAKDTADTTKLVQKVLGFDYETFHKQYVFAQEGVEPVTRMKDAGLKQFFLENVLNIEWTKMALERAKDDKKRVEAIISEIDYKKKNSYDKIKLHIRRISDYRTKMIGWAGEQEEKRQAAYAELKEVVGLLAPAKEQNVAKEEEIARLRKDLEAIKFEDYDKEIEKLEKAYRDAQIKEMRVKDTAKRNKEKIEKLQANIAQAEQRIGKPCPSCGTTLTKKHLPFFIGEARSEIAALEQTMSEDTSVKETLKSSSELILRSLSVSKEKREGEKDKRENAMTLKLKIRELENDMIDLGMVKREIKKVVVRMRKKENNPFDGLWVDERVLLKNEASNIRVLNERKKGCYEEIGVIDFWVKGFSGGGIQSFLLDSITPIINRNIAKYMSDLANSRIAVRIHTVKKLKSGEYRENFHIEVNNMDGSNSFISLSGGAKRRVDLAVSLAVADFRRGMGHKELKFLVIDEATAFLDAYWEERFYKLVKKNFSDFACFLITHKEIDPNLVDRVINVIKEAGETKIGKVA